MKSTPRSVLVFALFLFSLFLSGQPAQAKYAAIVIDAASGEVHHAVNVDTRNFPASLTKMMTLYLLFEAIEEGRLSLATEIKVSARAARQPASRLGLRAGDTITVETAIMALIVKSANDVASAVADTIAGGERRFALIMTAKARQIGMSRTTFRNSSGLPHRAQLSTARDMAILARAIIERFPRFYRRFAVREFTYQGKTYKTHNKVLTNYEGADGLKTGYIHASGYNLVTSAERGGRRLIGVIFGGKSARKRDALMKRFLDKAFSATAGAANIAALRRAPKRPAKIKPDYAQARGQANPSVPAKSKKRHARNPKSVWGIQVGAYYTLSPARDAAQAAAKKFPRILSGGRITVTPLKKSRNRVLYRARIVGLSKRTAYRACRLLKKGKVPCMELRLPGPLELAENAR